MFGMVVDAGDEIAISSMTVLKRVLKGMNIRMTCSKVSKTSRISCLIRRGA